MSKGAWLPGVIAGAVSGIIGAVAGVQWHADQVEERLAHRPPIAYLNIGEAAVEAAGSGRGRALLEEIRQKAGRLSDAGYIVLDSEMIVDAPDALNVPLSDYRGSESEKDNEAASSTAAASDKESGG